VIPSNSLFFGRLQATNPEVTISPSSDRGDSCQRVKKEAIMDIVNRTHPPHQSLCSQRILNTFAKIGAKVRIIKLITKLLHLFISYRFMYLTWFCSISPIFLPSSNHQSAWSSLRNSHLSNVCDGCLAQRTWHTAYPQSAEELHQPSYRV